MTKPAKGQLGREPPAFVADVTQLSVRVIHSRRPCDGRIDSVGGDGVPADSGSSRSKNDEISHRDSSSGRRLSTQTWVGASLILVVAALLTKALAIGRDVVSARCYGASAAIDAVTLALSVPMLAAQGIGFAVSTALVPVYRSALIRSGREAGNAAAATAVTCTLLLSAIVLIPVCIASRGVIEFIAPSLSEETAAYAATVVRWFALYVVVLNAVYVLTAAYHCHQHFIIPAFSELLFNSTIIAVLLAFWLPLGTNAIVAGHLAGILICLGLLSVQLFRRQPGILCPRLDVRHLRGLAVVAVPLVVIELGGQASLVVENFFASQLAEGSVAALGYARRLFTGLVALFALSVARGAFPTLSSLNAISDRPQLGKFVISVTNHFVLLFIPATFLLAFHGELVVRAVFLGGAFTEESVIATSGALAFYSAGFLFAAVEPVLIRTCYAISQPKHVLVSTVSSLLVLAVLSWPLVPTLGVSGIALATSVSCLVRVVYLVAALRRSLGGLGGIAGKRVKRTAIVSTLCCSVAQSTAWCLGSAAAFSAWGQAAVFVCLNALIAAVLLREELRDIAKVVMRQPRRSDSADSRFCPGDTP